MSTEPLNSENDNRHSSDPMIHVRAGILLYIAIAESVWTFGMIMREIFISIGIEPKNIELYTSCSELAVLIIFGPSLARYIKKIFRSSGPENTEKILMYLIFVIVGSVIITLLHNHSLVYLLPESYLRNLFTYENYQCKNPDSGWLRYYFELVKYIIIGLLFIPKRVETDSNNDELPIPPNQRH